MGATSHVRLRTGSKQCKALAPFLSIPRCETRLLLEHTCTSSLAVPCLSKPSSTPSKRGFVTSSLKRATTTPNLKPLDVKLPICTFVWAAWHCKRPLLTDACRLLTCNLPAADAPVERVEAVHCVLSCLGLHDSRTSVCCNRSQGSQQSDVH